MQSHRVIIDLERSLATTNSTWRRLRDLLLWACFCGFLHFGTPSILVAEEQENRLPKKPENPVQDTESALLLAEQQWQKAPTNTDLAVTLARLSFDLADIVSDKKRRAEVAARGMQVCEEALAQAPGSTGLHYYLAMNAGQLARTKSIGALKLVERMEQEFLKARQIDPGYDYAGPDRNLGLLYRDAPGWPARSGDRKNSIQHPRQAFQLHAEYPDNMLNLAESYAHWGDKETAEIYFKQYKAAIPSAQEKFRGNSWRSSWDDWSSRSALLEHNLSVIRPNNTAPKKIH
ncbi:MAG: hypothetical protein JWN25_492 [Verrucomicrobiales bacterium]|nr:hypothetical protein [Verrucomicrobiales bacterium]